MGMKDLPEDDRSRIRWGQARLRLPVLDLWLRYVALGGNLERARIAGYMADTGDLPDVDVVRLAAALNEEFTDLGVGHPIRVDSLADSSGLRAD